VKHVSTRALIAGAIELKGDDDEPIAVVQKALADLTKTVTDRLKDTPAAADLKTLTDRLAELEKKANRPGATVDDKEAANVERKALAQLLRSGSMAGIAEAGGIIEAKAASSDSDPAGGYFVLPTVDMTIRTLMTDLSPLRGIADVVTISTDSYERFYSLGKRGATWVAEREDRPQDTARPELKKSTYQVAELYAAPTATRHLLDDAATDIASWLIQNATHDFAETEGEAFLEGDGVEGKPRGLLDYGTTNEKDFTRAWGKHQYIPAGHASAPTDANLVTACIAIVAKLRKPYKSNARWLMNSTTAARLQGILDADGRRLWAPTGNLIEGVEHPLLGYPVEIDEGMPDIADGAGAHPIAFGDFRQGYVIVDRQGVRINRDELTQKGRVIFDVYKRVGGGAGDFNAIKFIKIAAS
jgi:HK97 family phage major capsid protein